MSQNDVIREESMGDLWNVWYSELHHGWAGLTLKVKQVVYSGQSPFQRIDILTLTNSAKCWCCMVHHDN